MRVSCLQLAYPERESKQDRVSRVLALIGGAGAADLVVLPELWPTGYFSFSSYQAEAEPLEGDIVTRLRQAAMDLDIHLMGGTFIERSGAGLANCAVLIGPDGSLLHTYRKMHLFSYGSEEASLLTAGAKAETVDTSLGRIATSTCYDLRFPELYRLFVDRGAELAIIPAAWPLARLEHWRVLLRARAVENQMFVISCNGAGWQEGTELAGHSMIVSPWGDVVAEAGEAQEVLSAEIDLAEVRRLRADFPVLEHRRISIGYDEG